jgi:hypothetical protein
MRTKRYKGAGRFKYLILLVITAAVASYLAYPVFYSGLISLKADPYKAVDISVSGEVDSFLPHFGSLLHLQGSKLSLLDGQGRTVWQVNLDGSSLSVFSIGEKIAVYNRSQNRIDGLDGDGDRVWSYSPSGSVKRINSDGNYLWIKYIKDGKGIVEIVDGGGHSFAYIPVGNVEVLAAAVSKDANHIAISAAQAEEGYLTGNLVLYKPDGTISWAKRHSDMLVLGIRITDDNRVIALTERALSSYNLEGIPDWQRDIKGYLSGAYIAEQGYSALSTVQDYRTGIPGKNPEKVEMYNNEGSRIASYNFDDRITGIFGNGDCVALVSGRTVMAIDLSAGRAVNLDFDFDINTAYLLDKENLACVSGGRVLFNTVKW